MGVDRAVLFRLTTSEGLERAVRALPGGEALTWHAASRYVAGRSRAEALDTARDLLVRGHGVSADLFGELVRDPDIGARIAREYVALAGVLPPSPADA